VLLIPDGFGRIIEFKGQKTALNQIELVQILQAAEKVIQEKKKFYKIGLKATIHQQQNQFYLYLSGLNHFFKYKEGIFEDMYRMNFHGYNFSAYNFFYKDQFYTYGGTGFWQNNGHLTYFNESMGEWELSFSTRDKIPVHRSMFELAFLRDNQLFFFIRERVNEKAGPVQYNQGLTPYAIDLNGPSLKQIAQPLTMTTSNEWLNFWFTFFETENYLVGINLAGSGFRILDKNNLSYGDLVKKYVPELSVKLDKQTLNENIFIVYSYGDVVELIDKEYIKYATLDLASLHHKIEAPKALFTFPTKKYATLAGGGVILIAFILFFFLYRRNQNAKTIPIGLAPTDFPFPKLLDYANRSIDQMELDNCLGIRDLSYNSARNKRSQMLKEIDLKHANILKIHRIQDAKDGRQFYYKIEMVD
jgi:hypothetical protein